MQIFQKAEFYSVNKQFPWFRVITPYYMEQVMLIIISYMYRYIYKYACFKFWKEKKLFLLGLCTLRVLSQEKNVDNPMKQTCISVILLQLYI